MQNIMDLIKELDAYSIAGGGVLIALLRLIPVLIQLFKNKKSVGALKDINWLYEQLNSLLHDTNSDLIWIGRGSNGGGIPKLGHQVFHTIMYQVGSVPASPKEVLVVDSGLTSMLLRVISSRVTILSTAIISGEFGTKLRSWNITKLYLFNVKITKKSVFYLGVGFKDLKTSHISITEQNKIIKNCSLIAKKIKI